MEVAENGSNDEESQKDRLNPKFMPAEQKKKALDDKLFLFSLA